MKKLLCALSVTWIMAGCQQEPDQVDLVVHHARIYTVDSMFRTASAMAIRAGKIIAVGTDQDILGHYKGLEVLDGTGQYIYPGFNDAHSHFLGYASGLSEAKLVGTKSWDEVLERVQQHAKQDSSPWIIGRGWDQNDWKNKQFPSKARLDELFPAKPVFLYRVDGHAAIANQAALDAAGIKPGQRIKGGIFETKGGKLTGILVDNAIAPVERFIPAKSNSTAKLLVKEAMENCFAVGLTSVSDCGVMKRDVLFLDALEKERKLPIRIYIMLSDDKVNFDWILRRGVFKTNHINVGGFKFYADGALGSRGACLLQDYSDQPGWKGFLLNDSSYFVERAKMMIDSKFQMCTHAIGDSANRDILRIYAAVLEGKNDRRWRIEHAQVVNQADFHYFGDYNIIPSVQPTHATSDMYWAEERLGKARLGGAYAFRELLHENAWMPLGTDFPVEDIDPLKTFYAAVFRVDSTGYPAGGFLAKEKLGREEALRGMTIWAAKASFDEKLKGSLEPGKWADFVVLDRDIMQVPDTAILKTKVTATYIGGKQVYKAPGR